MQIIGGIITIIASYIAGKFFKKLLQYFRKKELEKEIKEARESSQELNTKANLESEKLKEIDGR